jgi:hypothetical protein
MGKGSRSRFSSSTAFSPPDDLVMQHQPNRLIRDIPRRQTQVQRPTVHVLFQRKGEPAQFISMAYRQYGFRLTESADYVGVHAATVSRRLKQVSRRCMVTRPELILGLFYNPPPCEARMPFSIRPFRRFPVQCAVNCNAGSFQGQDTIWNLSCAGWRLSGNLPMRPGETLSLTVTLPNEQHILIPQAVIRWSRGWELAVKNILVQRHTHARLKHYSKRLVQESTEIVL